MTGMEITEERQEALGPAERTIETLLKMTDHMVHNRPGIVRPVNGDVGVAWAPCTWKQEGDEKVVYELKKVGKKTLRERVGVLADDNRVMNGVGAVAEYRVPHERNGLFPEVVTYLYRQVADIWQADNAFAAHWASYAFKQEHRDIKTVLAAFMLAQSRCGDPVSENGEFLFNDDDYRAVGEAMMLIRGRGYMQLDPYLIVRIGDVLNLEGVVAINRELGFGRSARSAPTGRYEKAVKRWLRYRETNPAMLRGLVNSGQANIVKTLARRVRYKPLTDEFFEILGWSQKANAHREMAIGKVMAGTDSMEGLDETGICQRVVADKIGYKRLVGMLPKGQEMTRAIMGACIEAGGVSDKELIILTPTLEELGLLTVEPFASRWKEATQKATDQRAANIARNVQSREAREGLEDASDKATTKALEEVTRGLRVYCMVDKSSSMQGAIEKAIAYLSTFLGGFPLDRLHVSVFNTIGTEVKIQAPRRAAVEHAFKGHGASGGTLYAAGLQPLFDYKPAADEDALFLFVGDQCGERGEFLANYIRQSGINPVAFGFLYVPGVMGQGHRTVEAASVALGIPCFMLEEAMFEGQDPYAIPRIMRDMIAAAPTQAAVGKRESLIETILKTPLLERPTWADAL